MTTQETCKHHIGFLRELACPDCVQEAKDRRGSTTSAGPSPTFAALAAAMLQGREAEFKEQDELVVGSVNLTKTDLCHAVREWVAKRYGNQPGRWEAFFKDGQTTMKVDWTIEKPPLGDFR